MGSAEIVSIGWDVSGWQSRTQAVAIAAVDDSGLRWPAGAPAFGFETGRRPGLASIIEGVGEPALAGFLDGADRVVIAIDAPLTFPRAFVDLLRGDARRYAAVPREIDNPLAYRDCDRWISAEHGKKPLSAAFDLLGNPATLAMAACTALREDGYRVVPLDGEPADRSVIEVYPGIHKRGTKRADAAIEPLARHLPDGAAAGSDLYDAALCALLGLVFAGAAARLELPPLEGPGPGFPTDEGWIYALPADYVRLARGAT